MTDLVSAALAYADRGWPVFPCRPGGKEPAGHLVPTGVKMATTDESLIRSWWLQQPDANIGIATGWPGPDVLDVDVKPDGDGWPAYAELQHAGLIPDWPPLVTTPSGGLHVYFAGTQQRNSSLRGRHIDFRSAGGYVVAPPSHIGGKLYTLDQDAGLAVSLDWLAVRVLLDPPPDPPAFQQPARSHDGPREELPGADWAAQTSWPQILEPHGWRRLRDLGNGRALWTRPGKHAGISATTRDDGGLYVFSTSTPFDTEVPYTRFGALAVLQFDGDHTAAARWLKQQGYGRQTPIMVTPPVAPPAAAETVSEPRQSRLEQIRGALVISADLDNMLEPEPLIDGILYRDSLAWLHGKPGHGKSFVALDWACCVASGLPWQMHGTTQGRVLYIIAEGVSGLRPRVRAWEDYARECSKVTFLPVPVQLGVPADLAAVTQVVADMRPLLVVIDTQARVSVGRDENSSKDMGEFVAAADSIRQASDACVLIVHHESRAGDNMRGSTALEGAATTLVRVTKDGTHLKIDNPKQKDAAEFDPIRLRLVPRLNSAVCMPFDSASAAAELSETENRIIETLRETFGTKGAPGSTLMEVLAMSKSTFYRTANSLVNRGMVAEVGSRHRRHYVLPELMTVPQSHLVPGSPAGESVPSPTVPHPFRGGTTGTETEPGRLFQPPAAVR
jgi:hypothetical protein